MLRRRGAQCHFNAKVVFCSFVVFPIFPRPVPSGTSRAQAHPLGRCATGGGGPRRHDMSAGACKGAAREQRAHSTQPAMTLHQRCRTCWKSGTLPRGACQRFHTHVHMAPAVETASRLPLAAVWRYTNHHSSTASTIPSSSATCRRRSLSWNRMPRSPHGPSAVTRPVGVTSGRRRAA